MSRRLWTGTARAAGATHETTAARSKGETTSKPYPSTWNLGMIYAELSHTEPGPIDVKVELMGIVEVTTEATRAYRQWKRCRKSSEPKTKIKHSLQTWGLTHAGTPSTDSTEHIIALKK